MQENVNKAAADDQADQIVDVHHTILIVAVETAAVEADGALTVIMTGGETTIDVAVETAAADGVVRPINIRILKKRTKFLNHV
jgi:hypothetical protein